jgi:hypothetical protein
MILQISASAQRMLTGQWACQWDVITSVVTAHLPARAFLPVFHCRHLRRVQQFLYSFWIITICFVTCKFCYYVIARDIDGHVVVKLQQCWQSWYSGNVYVYVQWTVNFIAFYLWYLWKLLLCPKVTETRYTEYRTHSSEQNYTRCPKNVWNKRKMFIYWTRETSLTSQ